MDGNLFYPKSTDINVNLILKKKKKKARTVTSKLAFNQIPAYYIYCNQVDTQNSLHTYS